MFKSMISASAVALCVLGGSALAQDNTSTADQPSTTDQQTATDQQTGDTTAEQGSADEVLDLGQPVSEGPQLGDRYAKETHGDWTLACIKTEAETDPCSLLQVLNGPDGSPMAEVSLFRLEPGSKAVAGATVIVPLETLLPAQLTISVDGAAGKRYNYSFCNPIGCVAQIGLTQADINSFKKGNKAVVSLVPAPAPDQRLKLDMSLTGFTAGFNVVDVVKN